VRRAIESHLASRQVSRVIYGAIIGLALLVAIEDHPPTSVVVIATLIGTAVAVGLAEFYSDMVGSETRLRRHLQRSELRHIFSDVAAVALGILFPVLFFVLSAAHAIEEDTAFDVAEWTGVGLLALYGFAASRLAGERITAAALRGLAVGLIGAFLIGLKSLLH
jgi:hypothetical protein